MSRHNSEPDGGPAFAVREFDDHGTLYRGMSLRDYFAAKAMQGFIAASANPNALGTPQFPEAAAHAYQYADAMLKERFK